MQHVLQHHCCGMNDGTDFASAEMWDRTWAIDGELRTINVSVACCVTEGDFPTSKLIDEYCPIAPNSNNSYSNIVSSYTKKCHYIVPVQGCPIYGKIRFLRIVIACFSLRTKHYLWPNIRIFSYSARQLPPPPIALSDRGIVRKKRIFGRIYGFFRTEFGYYPHPPALDSRYFARAELTSVAAPSELFRLLSEISVFLGIPIGQPRQSLFRV